MEAHDKVPPPGTYSLPYQKLATWATTASYEQIGRTFLPAWMAVLSGAAHVDI